MKGLRPSIRLRTARHSCARFRPRGGWWLVATLLLVARPAPPRAQAAPLEEPKRFSLIFSSRMFMDVHESDAKAAVIAWAQAVARERHMHLVPEPRVIDGVPSLGRALNTGQGDFVTLTTDEYLSLGVDTDQDSFLVGTVGREVAVKYLLLVNKDSDIRDLAGLKGRSILFYENSRTCLAPPWLDTILMEKALPPATAHCATVGGVKKLSGAVLPVFFHQADACVVTNDGLETLSELNPQVGSQLRVLAASPGLVHSVAYARVRALGALDGVDLFTEVKLLHTSAPGRQLLNLFKVDKLVAVPASAISGVRELLATHRRLLARWKSTGGKPHTASAKPRAAAAAAVAASEGQSE